MFIAELLCTFVHRFVFMHELGHLLNGHCAYINNKTNGKVKYMPMCPEDIENKNGKEKESGVSYLDYRTMEMDADAFSVQENLKYIIYLYEEFDNMFNKPFYIKPMDLFFWWTFAIRSQFLLQQDSLIKEFFCDEMTHLPSIGRWGLIWGLINRIVTEKMFILNYKNGDSEQKMYKALMDGVLQAEIYYNKIKYTNYNSVREIINNEEFAKYEKEINNNWNNNLLAILREYCRIKI